MISSMSNGSFLAAYPLFCLVSRGRIYVSQICRRRYPCQSSALSMPIIGRTFFPRHYHTVYYPPDEVRTGGADRARPHVGGGLEEVQQKQELDQEVRQEVRRLPCLGLPHQAGKVLNLARPHTFDTGREPWVAPHPMQFLMPSFPSQMADSPL